MSLHGRHNFARTRSERARCVSERVEGEKTWFQPWNMSIEVGSPMLEGFDVFACKAHPSLRRNMLRFGISPSYAQDGVFRLLTNEEALSEVAFHLDHCK